MLLEDFPYAGETTVIKKLLKTTAPLFLRFGHFQSQTGECSMNWATMTYEDGVCVIPAQLVDGSVRPDQDWLGYLEDSWEIFSQRTVYVLTGRTSTIDGGKGSAGEPVLQPSSIVRARDSIAPTQGWAGGGPESSCDGQKVFAQKNIFGQTIANKKGDTPMSEEKTNPLRIILNHPNPTGRSFLAQRPDGLFLAGPTEQTARLFSTARAVYDHYRPFAEEGDHSAWSICYFVEDFLKEQNEEDVEI